MKRRVNVLNEIAQRTTIAAIVALVNQRFFFPKYITAGFILVLFGIATDRAAKIIQLFRLLLEVVKLRRKKANILMVNINHNKEYIKYLKKVN